MSDNTTNPSIQAWSIPLEEPPNSDATHDEVAAFLLELEAGGLLWPNDQYRSLATWQAKRYCEAQGHDWKQVSPRFRKLKARDLAKIIETPDLFRTVEGVLVNESLVTKLEDEGWLPACPIHLTAFSQRRFDHYSVTKDCDKPWCLSCGVKRLACILEHLEMLVTGWESVYTATTPYEGRKTVDRVRQRHHTVPGSEYFMYRRSDDNTVIYVATDPLDGGRSQKPPKEWLRRTPSEVMSWLRNEVMVFPNYENHAWSAGWQLVRPDRSLDGLQGESEYRWFNLTSDQAKLVQQRLEEEVQRELGLYLDLVPVNQYEGIWQRLLRIIDEVRAKGRPSPSS
jgi:hypothetical protein